jgi:DNA replication protein DnaC
MNCSICNFPTRHPHRPPLCSQCEPPELRRARRLAEEMQGVPCRYRDAHFELPDLSSRCGDASAIAKAKAAVSRRPLSALLVGPAGAGKSTLAACMIHASAAAYEGTTHAFVNACDLGTARARHSLGSEAPVVLAAIESGLLVVDELGREKTAHHDATSDVVFSRHERAKPTIYTSGLTIVQLEARYDDGFCRRLLENAVVIDVRPRGLKR